MGCVELKHFFPLVFGMILSTSTFISFVSFTSAILDNFIESRLMGLYVYVYKSFSHQPC